MGRTRTNKASNRTSTTEFQCVLRRDSQNALNVGTEESIDRRFSPSNTSDAIESVSATGEARWRFSFAVGRRRLRSRFH